ncbi:MAG: hypothetical protein GEU86_01830 [Actinophytocola sp.]|nr:hypothetical protein [Actinophytocola sp.]
MEFLVRIDINWPQDAPEERERIFAQELEAGQRLARARHRAAAVTGDHSETKEAACGSWRSPRSW